MNPQKQNSNKIAVTAKAPIRQKPNIEISIPPGEAEKGKKNTTIPNQTIEMNKTIDNNNNFKSSSTLISPNHQKVTQIYEQNHQESQLINSAKMPNSPKEFLQKKISAKEPVFKQQSKIEPNRIGSPKFAVQKEKVLFSYASQKNLMIPQKQQIKRPQLSKINPQIEELHSRQAELKAKVQFLQRQLDQAHEKIKQFDENAKKNEQVILELSQKNEEICKKFETMKKLSDETKKMLHAKINIFNTYEGEIITQKQKIKDLENKLINLKLQNQNLKKHQNAQNINNSVLPLAQTAQSCGRSQVSSFQDEVFRSQISHNFFNDKANPDSEVFQFNEDNLSHIDKSIFNEDIVQDDTEETQNDVLHEYQHNIDIFAKIKSEYEEILKDIEKRYIYNNEQIKKVGLEKEKYVQSLENQIDCLHQKIQEMQNGHNELKLSLQMDKTILQKLHQITTLHLKFQNLREQNRKIKEDLLSSQMQVKCLEAQLDVERMKKRIVNQNQRFQFNVVKFNMFNVIEKYKSQLESLRVKHNKLKRILEDRSK